jgi:hypothetical protein
MSNDRIQAFLERNKDKITLASKPKFAPRINMTATPTTRKLSI